MIGKTIGKGDALAAHAELILKIATGVFGIFYVLGLLVTNVHLIKLGISDFNSLQARNIMTGFLFVFYVLLLFLVVSPWSAALYIFGRTMISARRLWVRMARCFGVLAITLTFSAMVAWLEGLVMGYMFPWGRSWDAGFTRHAWTWQFIVSDFQRGFGQFADSFWHMKIIVAGLLILVALLPFVRRVKSRFHMVREDVAAEQSPFNSLLVSIGRPFLKPAFSLSYLLLALPLILVGFSQEVYPNVPHNFGGGQPNIVELYIRADNAVAISSPVRGKSSLWPHQADMDLTGPVAIWYQSDKFLYITPLPDFGPTPVRLIALDIARVSTIQFLRGSVRVASGSRILSVYSE